MPSAGAGATEGVNAAGAPVWRPTIKRGEVLARDHLSAPHASPSEEVAAACRAQGIGLAPSSPDLSPSARRWSPIKTARRAAKARTREELERAVQAARERLTAADCWGWFTHGGEQVAPNCN
jgi:hypothetical protein